MDREKTMERLRKRAEFLAVAEGQRASRRGFVLQMRGPDAKSAGRVPRFGFTVTKKMGNSPERNRIRRRLREAVRLAAAPHAATGADYVLVGRRAALSQPFADIVAELISGLGALARRDNGDPTAPRGRRTTAKGSPARSSQAAKDTTDVR